MRGARQVSVLMGSSQSVLSFVLLGLLVLGARLVAALLRAHTSGSAITRSICSACSMARQLVTNRTALWRDVTVVGWLPTASDLGLRVTRMQFAPLVPARVLADRSIGRIRTGRMFEDPPPYRQAFLTAGGQVGGRDD